MDSFAQLLQASGELEKQKLEEGRTQNGNIISSPKSNKETEKKQDITNDEKQNSEPEKYINVSITTNAHKKLKTLSSLTGKNIRDLMTEIIDERFKATFEAELKKFSSECL